MNQLDLMIFLVSVNCLSPDTPETSIKYMPFINSGRFILYVWFIVFTSWQNTKFPFELKIFIVTPDNSFSEVMSR